MNNKCGDCIFFKKSDKSINGICTNNHARVSNKLIRTVLSKKCNWFTNSTIIKSNTTFTDYDERIINHLIYKFEKEHPSETNLKRASALKHLLQENKNLQVEINKIC